MERVGIWKELQDLEWDMYKDTAVGVFSVDGLPGAEDLGVIIGRVGSKRCLDIGCGALALPAYMKVAVNVEFTGVDPYKGDVKRKFKFVQGHAELLPFENNSFDMALFATSLDHILEPDSAIIEAHRVLEDDGKLLIWLTLRAEDERYEVWLENFPVAYDDYHLWAFTEKSLLELVAPKFECLEKISVGAMPSERVFILEKV